MGSTDRPRLPVLPLSALRAFEAAARRGSMSGAAEEFSVTHGAVSRQVAALERLTGQTLFERGARGVRLTETGQRLFVEVSAGFERLRAALAGAAGSVRPVRLTTLPSFATRWLLPRMVTFRGRHPEIDVRIHSSLDVIDLSKGEFDLSIRYGRGTWPGMSVELLLQSECFPVCSPAFAARLPAPASAADLLTTELIHNAATERWSDWFGAHGVAAGEIPRGIVVDDYALALEYALGGHGVALGREALVHDYLERELLVRPVAGAFPSHFAYYLVRPPSPPLSAEAALFAAWLLDAAKAAGTCGADPAAADLVERTI